MFVIENNTTSVRWEKISGNIPVDARGTRAPNSLLQL